MSDDSTHVTTRGLRQPTTVQLPTLPVVLTACLTITSVAGTIIRFGPRDRIQSLAIFFYALPPIVIATAAIVASLLIRRQQTALKWPVAAIAIIQCCLLLPLWNQPADQTVQENATAPQVESTLGFWNVGGGSFGWNGIINQAGSWDAEIIGLAEASEETELTDGEATEPMWTTQFPEHKTLKFPRGMRLLSKHPARIVSQGELAERSHYGIAEVQIEGHPVYVVMADLLSGPSLPRGPSFQALINIIDQLPDRPVILMGDMNTPTESVHLNALRARLGNAFEEKGNGFYCTWPSPCPVLPLDQVWTNDKVEITSCRLEWTLQSDHRPIVSTFRIPTEHRPRTDFNFTSLTRSVPAPPSSLRTQGM